MPKIGSFWNSPFADIHEQMSLWVQAETEENPDYLKAKEESTKKDMGAMTSSKAKPEEEEEGEEFPTKGMTPIHKKWLNSKGKLSGRDKKRVSRFVGDRQYHLMETNWGEYKKRKAKETLLSALQDDYSDSAIETGIETESFLVEKEKELETLFSNLHEVNRTKFHSRPWAPWFTEEAWSAEKEKTMDGIRKEIREVYTELSYLK